MDTTDFKLGDRVICLEGFDTGDSRASGGGYGYKPGFAFIVESIMNSDSLGQCCFRENYEGGVWGKALKLYNPVNAMYERLLKTRK